MAYLYPPLVQPFITPSVQSFITPGISTISALTNLPSGVLPTPVIYPGSFVPPQLPLMPQFNLDYDEDIRDKLIRFFFYKTLDKWLYDDMSDILGYLEISGNRVTPTGKMVSQKESDASTEQKIKFIETYVLTKRSVRKLLTKFVDETSTRWAQLYKNESFVKEVIHSYLKKKLSNPDAVKELVEKVKNSS